MTGDYFTPCKAQDLIKRLDAAQGMVIYWQNKNNQDAVKNWLNTCDNYIKQIEIICNKLETFANRKEGRVKDIMILQIKSIRSAAGLE